MRHKGWIIIEFKYEGEGWYEYDRTKVPNWAKVQYDRCVSEHKDADVRIRKEK